MLLSSSVTVAVFLTGSTFVGASRWHIPPQRDVFIREYPSNSSTNVSLWAPYYRNVSAGAAWVIPQSTFDLGARAMSCECFNPDRKHLNIPTQGEAYNIPYRRQFNEH